MKNLKLLKTEMTACKNLFEKIVADPALLDRKLKELNLDPAKTRGELAQGVDEFYGVYAGEVNADTIKAKIAEATASMPPLQQYTYYANLLTAISHIGGKVFNDGAWTKCLEDHQNILTAIDLGLIGEDDLHITAGIETMQALVAENLDAFAVLFVEDPAMAELQESCITGDPAKVKAVALNTRELAIDMAAAVYVMQESGELKSLGDTRYSARDIGIMSATILEVDAAKKTGSLDVAKKVLAKASKTALALIVAAPGALVAGIATIGIISNFVSLSGLALLIGGIATAINMSVGFDAVYAKLNPIFAKGAKLLETTLDKVKPLYSKVSDWVQNTVIPAALPAWEKCRTFTYEKIMVPAVAFVLKTKNVILKTAETIAEKAKAFYEKMTHKASDLKTRAANAAENLVKSAQNLAQTAAEVDDTPAAGGEVISEEPIGFEIPLVPEEIGEDVIEVRNEQEFDN